MEFGYYRISFSLNGKSRHDIYFADNAQEAVDFCRRDYEPMGKVRIDHVWRDGGTTWLTTDAWD